MTHVEVEYRVTEDASEFGAWTGYRVPEDRASWHPLAVRLYDYWRSIAPPDRLPGRQHIMPEDIAPLWSRLCLLDVCREPLRYRYRVCGTDLVRSLGCEATGRWVDEVHPQLVDNPQSRDRFRYMVMTGHPTWRRGAPLWTHHPDHRTIESCVVPLAADGQVVDRLIGVNLLFNSTGRLI